MVVKALAFVALGVAGWWHRRATLVALESPARGVSFRLVGGEVVLRGAAFGIATASPLPSPERLEDRQLG